MSYSDWQGYLNKYIPKRRNTDLPKYFKPEEYALIEYEDSRDLFCVDKFYVALQIFDPDTGCTLGVSRGVSLENNQLKVSELETIPINKIKQYMTLEYPL